MNPKLRKLLKEVVFLRDHETEKYKEANEATTALNDCKAELAGLLDIGKNYRFVVGNDLVKIRKYPCGSLECLRSPLDGVVK